MFSDIKKGFLLGIGFIIPLLIVGFIVIKYSVFEMAGFATDSIEQAFNESFSEDEIDFTEGIFEDFNKSYVEQISLSDFTERYQGSQLLIAAQFTNNSDKVISNLEIEAELFDADGKFVYECSKSIYEEKAPGIAENFIIKCGCSENGVPDYQTVKLRVVKATSY